MVDDDPEEHANLLAAVLAAVTALGGGEITLTVEEIAHTRGMKLGIKPDEELGLIRVFLKAPQDEIVH